MVLAFNVGRQWLPNAISQPGSAANSKLAAGS
jgi:hypothetical protein